MVNKSRGILKNGPRYHEEDASSENLLFSPDPFHAAHIETTIDLGMPTVERPEKSEKRAHDESAFVEVGLANESDCESTHKEHHPAVHRVQFPDTVSKAPPYIRQDTDVMSTRSGASSVYGGDEDDSEDYDWSDEEDLVDEQAKFNKKLSSKKGTRAWGPTRILSLLFSSLIGSVFLACILITPALLVHFYWYKPHPTEYRTYVKDNIEAWLFWTAANLVISWGLAMIIDLFPVVLRYFIAAIWGHVSESVKARLEIYESVKGTVKPAFYAGSAYASWTIIFQHIYKLFDAGDNTNSRAQYTNRLAQVVEFFFFLIIVWRIQAMVSHFIAFAFHQVAYKERIAEVENSLVVIEKLRQYKPKNQFRHAPNKSGTRTPTFGWMTPLSNAQHYNLLHSALQETSKGEAEILAGTRTRKHERGVSFEHPPSNRLSWQNFFEGNSQSGHGHKRTQPSYDLNEYPTEVVAAPELNDGVAVELEVLPNEPASGQVFTAAPAVPSHLNPHRYPPNTGKRPNSHGSSDDEYHAYGSPGQGGVAGAATTAAEVVDATIRQTAKALKTAVLHDARNIKGNADERGGLGWNIHSAREAKRLARSIFTRFKDRGRSWLIAADFYPAFPDHASAEAAFKVFDKDSNGDISRAEIKTALLKIYKERRFLSRSMRDVGEALQTLDRVLLCVAIVIMFFIALSVFGVEVGDSLTSVYTLGIAASFIFKASASSAFDAIMFLFVTHPYDTGDRVLINDQNMVVKKVGLFATVFLRADGTETYYFNSQLFTQFILNMRRSGKTFENVTMQVAWTTPLTKLDALERSLNDWLSTEENRWFEPSTNIVLQNIAFQRYLEITIGIGHNGNWQDWGLHNIRRTAFHAAVHYYCRELGIVGYEATMPIVYADPVTHTYSPEAAADVLSPTPASPTPSLSRRDAEETERQAKEMKPLLGFLPPIHDRSSHLTRARKSRNRKANLGAGNG